MKSKQKVHLTTAELIKIFAGELLKLSQHPKYRKKMELQKRKEQNEKVLKNMDKKGRTEPDNTQHKRATENLVEKIDDIQDLGSVIITYPMYLPDHVQKIIYDYWDAAQNMDIEDAVELAKKYQQENKKIQTLETILKAVYNESEPNLKDYAEIQFYLLPEDQFGKANVGVSSNLKDPTINEIIDAIDSILGQLQYYTIAIYSDDKEKYQNIVDRLGMEAQKFGA